MERRARISDVQGIDGVSPVVSGTAQVIAGAQNWSTRIQGVTPPYLSLENWTIAQGASFTDQDNTNSNNVAVLGHGHLGVADVVHRQLRRLNTNSRFHYAAVVELF